MRQEFPRTCSVADCNSKTVGRGLCRKHYSRWYKHGNTVAKNTPKGDLLRWIVAHSKWNDDDCLIWPFNKTNRCGSIAYNGKKVVATRVMCEIAHGVSPVETHDAAHSCGNGHKYCINPKHLRWASKKENQADRILHGTALLGDANPASKLTPSRVLEIRNLAGFVAQKKIAQEAGISRSHVGAIISRKRWGWL